MHVFADRLVEISSICNKFDIIGLPGTMVRQLDKTQPIQQFHIQGSRFSVLQWGYVKSKWVNTSCGGSMLIGPKSRRHIASVHEPPRAITGRSAAGRISTATVDVLVCLCYFPTKVDAADLGRLECVRTILDGFSGLLQKSPSRTIPLAMGDLNFKLGFESKCEAATGPHC